MRLLLKALGAGSTRARRPPLVAPLARAMRLLLKALGAGSTRARRPPLVAPLARAMRLLLKALGADSTRARRPPRVAPSSRSIPLGLVAPSKAFDGEADDGAADVDRSGADGRFLARDGLGDG